MNSLSYISGYALTLGFLIFGFLICFWGYKLFKLSVTVAGVILGFMTGRFILELLLQYAGYVPPKAVSIVIPLLFALVLGVLAFSFYRKAFIFVVAAVVARALYLSIAQTSFSQKTGTFEDLIVMVICGIVGIAAGIGCFLIQKGAIIVMSGFGGASLIKAAVLPYLTGLSFVTEAATFITEKLFAAHMTPSYATGGLIILIFTIAGIIVQAKQKT